MRGSWLLLLAACGRSAPTPFLDPALPCEPRGIATEVSFDPSSMLCVHIELPGEDFEALAVQQRFGTDGEDQLDEVIDVVLRSCDEAFPDPYTWFEADVEIDGAALVQVGVRKKGFVGSVQPDSRVRPSLKLKLDRFVEDQTLGDTERVTLNNNLTDRSRMHTCLFYSVFADAGYPAPRCNLANVSVNGTPRGAYTHVEDVKKAFLREHFGDASGSLYESTVADFVLAQVGEGLGRWEAKTDDTDATGAPLRRVAEALLAPDDELEQALDDVLDLDRFFTFWALEILLGHWDGYAGNTNNALVYFDPADERAVMIPWGPDDAMQRPAAGMVQGELARRLSIHPTLYGRLDVELQRLLEEVWDEDVLQDRLASFALQVRTAEEGDDFAEREAELSAWIAGRRAEIETLLSEGLPVGPEEPGTCGGPLRAEDFHGVGELVGLFAHGCSTAPTGFTWIPVARRR